jgi:hypothetical protein
VAVLVTWMSFASVERGLRRGVLSTLETHIMMSSLSFHLVLTHVLRLALFLVLCLSSLMDLIIAHMVVDHERLVFLLELLTPTMSPDTWTVHVFPVVVHVPLDQMVRC